MALYFNSHKDGMETKRILALGTDLFFMPQIGDAAQAAGFGFDWVESPLSAEAFVEALAAAPTALVVLDLTCTLPWQEWLPAAKGHPATDSIPWMAFGRHDNPASLKEARAAGMDKVAVRAQLGKALRETLAEVG